MDTGIFCILCGAPFALEPGIYHLDPDRDDLRVKLFIQIRPENNGTLQETPPEHWLYNVQLIGVPSAFQNHIMNGPVLDLHDIEDGNGNVIASEVISWSITDVDCFFLHGSYYRVLHEDTSGDMIFPLHENCMLLTRRALEFHCKEHIFEEKNMYKSHLYDALKSHYSLAKSSGTSMCPDALHLLASPDLFGYSKPDSVDSLGWWSGTHEKYLSDPINAGGITKHICNALRKKNSTSFKLPLLGSSDPSRRLHGIEGLPNELLDRVTEYLPARAVIALHYSSRLLAEKISIDDRFWRSHLCNGSLLPHVWDLSEEEFNHHVPNTVDWDWKGFLNSLKSDFYAKDTPLNNTPGLWNRRRILDRIGTILRPPIRDEISIPSHTSQVNEGSHRTLSTPLLAFFTILAMTIAWDLRFLINRGNTTPKPYESE